MCFASLVLLVYFCGMMLCISLLGRRTCYFQEYHRTPCRKKKEIIRHFKEQGLKITIESNLKSADQLDITHNLANGHFQPYRKPNDKLLYINTKSNHPPTVIKQLPAPINRRLSALSFNKDSFDKAKSLYDKALRSSGFIESLHHCKKTTITPAKRNRSRNIIWFNPPYSKNVQTNVAKTFLQKINLSPIALNVD